MHQTGVKTGVVVNAAGTAVAQRSPAPGTGLRHPPLLGPR